MITAKFAVSATTNRGKKTAKVNPPKSECEPWWWVMQTGFYSLVYCVYDFATAVQYGSQLPRRHVPHINGGHGSIIMFTTWWQFFRCILGIMYLGSWLSSEAARLAIGEMVVFMDRDAARSLFIKMEQEFWKGYEAVVTY